MPYWRLSAFYFFFFGSLGAFAPYWSVYLDSLGFNALEIGQLMAILTGTRIVAPNVWGWIADHTGHRVRIVRIGCFLALLFFTGVFFGTSFVWLATVMAAFTFFWNAALPQFEAATLNHLGPDAHRYTQIRIWGSIGFIAVVAGLGPLLERHGVGMLPAVCFFLMAGIWFAAMLAPDDGKRHHESAHGALRSVLRQGPVIAVLVVCFLMQASHGPYYTFYSLYLEAHGYSRGAVGLLWALGVGAEVALYLVLHRIFHRYALELLLVVALAVTTLRWILIGNFVDNVPVVLFAQLLHAASFGLYHAVAIQLIHRYFVGRSQGRGQALYSSLGFGAGGALGSLYSGYMWESAGPTATFLTAAACSATATIIAVRLLWRAR